VEVEVEVDKKYDEEIIEKKSYLKEIFVGITFLPILILLLLARVISVYKKRKENE